MSEIKILRRSLKRKVLKIESLLKKPDLEISIQDVVDGSSAWISPGEDPSLIEVYFILKGKVSITIDDEENIISEGEGFYVNQLTEDLHMRILEESSILCISNRAVYDDIANFQETLNYLISISDMKNPYIKGHGVRCRYYFDLMYEKIPYKDKINYENMVLALQLHDVGKSHIDNRILANVENLSESEELIYRSHPKEGAKIVRAIYGDEVGDLVEFHHERLDGSGYYGLKEEAFSEQLKILTIIAQFDYLSYHHDIYSDAIKVESIENAAKILYDQPELFDRNITKYMYDLIKDGKIKEY